MKLRILTALLMVVGATAAVAQTSGSTSTSGASSTISPTNTNLGNGASTSGSSAGAQAGSAGNVMNYNVDNSVPSQQTIRTYQYYDGYQYNERGGTDTTNINQEFSGKYTIRNTPNVVAPNILPTSPCMGSTSIGVGVTAFGISGGSSWKDQDCGIRETARVFFQANMAADGLAVLCASEYAATAPACRAIKKAEEQSGPITASARIDEIVREPRTYQIVNPKETQIRDQNDTYRNLDKGGNFNKTAVDSEFTKAAMKPTEGERKLANCEIARKMGDDLLGARFGCPKQ